MLCCCESKCYGLNDLTITQKGVGVLIFLFLFSCSSEEKAEYSGSELLEMYYDASCELSVQPECISEFASCNAPVNAYGDWADCMNYMHSSFSHCGILGSLFEENQLLVMDCVDHLQELECTYENICPAGESVLESGGCGEVFTILMGNCSPF